MLAPPEIDTPGLQRFGYPEYVIGTSPAAGQKYVQAIGGNWFVRLLSVFFTFTPSATVASRTPYVEFVDASSRRFALSGAPLTVPASDTTDFYFSVWRTYADWEVDATVLVPLERTILLPTMSWKIGATAIDATDTITNVRFMYERFDTSGQPPGA